MKDLVAPKRLTLLVCLLHRAQVQARDDLAEMLIKRLNRIHVAGKEELERLRAEHRETIETLVTALADVLGVLEGDPSDAEAGQRVKDALLPHGGVQQLLLDCEAVSAYNGNNDLPLLWCFFRSHRSTLFRLARTLTLRATTQDRTVMAALQVALDNHFYAGWQQRQYIHSMFSAQHHTLDNNRSPDLRWTALEDLFKP